MKEKRQREENFSTVTNAFVLIGLLLFLVMFSPLNNVSGLLAKHAPVTYQMNNMPLEAVPDTPCYDSDAPTGIELLKTQIFTAGLVESSDRGYYDECVDERFLEENVCVQRTSGDQREKRLVECPPTMTCQQGRCVR